MSATIQNFVRTCKQRGVVPTRYLLTVNIAKQTTTLWERDAQNIPPFRYVKNFRCSTSKYGIGEKAGSNMTPRGLHRIAKKIGGGFPVGAAWKSRELIGYTWTDQPFTPIAHRIMWLEGLEPGRNRGEGIDTFQRFVYIHGTGNETTIGRPDSHGCVHLSANDLIPLYDKLPEGTLVWIAEN
jgi:lipoprotein-anchoring transpeptidase ErfK/SrfK